MKYVLILCLLAGVSFFLYWRLRPYIRAARRIMVMMREVRRVQEGRAPSDFRAEAVRPGRGGRLVRCASCGAWRPASEALALKSGATYCAASCLERAAQTPTTRRKSAS